MATEVYTHQVNHMLFPWSPAYPAGDKPDVYDLGDGFTQEDYRSELAYVERCIARYDAQAIQAIGLPPYRDEQAVAKAVERGELVDATPRASDAYKLIYRLQTWQQGDKLYSPPFLRPDALLCLRGIAQQWHERIEEDRRYKLSVTSLVRPLDYQKRLGSMFRKVAADSRNSSHPYGLAFDIDARGIYEMTADGTRPLNDMDPDKDRRQKVIDLMGQLAVVLDNKMLDGEISYIDELPDTQNACFHICAMPDKARSQQ